MSIYKVDEDGVEALNTVSSQVVEAGDELMSLTDGLENAASDNPEGLGPHIASLQNALEDIRSAIRSAKSPADEVSQTLSALAKRYENIIGDDPFGNPGGTASSSSGAAAGAGNTGDSGGNVKSQGKRYSINSEGNREYRDDNSNVFRINDDLIPNNTYVLNGYTYKTDSLGRISSANGTLHMSNHDRLTIADSIEVIGKGDELETDDRGHIIGDQFDGSNGLENMTPQDAHVNRQEVKNLEMELAREVKDGKDASVEVYPIYDGDSRRPSGYVYEYSIDGLKDERLFENYSD